MFIEHTFYNTGSLLIDDLVQYISAVDVWLEYVQFCIGGMGQIDGISHIRDVFERALGTAGLHVSAGSSLWEAYREFENALMSGYMVSEMWFFPSFFS